MLTTIAFWQSFGKLAHVLAHNDRKLKQTKDNQIQLLEYELKI